MIKKFLLSLMALASLIMANYSAQARIDFTLDECIKQYGTPYANLDVNNYEWHIGETYVQAWFDNGKVVFMHYARPFLKQFTGSEIQDLYLKNGGHAQGLILELYGTFGDDIPLVESSSSWVQSFRIITPEWSVKEQREKAVQAAFRAKEEAEKEAAKKKAFNSL